MKFISALALLSAAVLATETNTEVQAETKTETEAQVDAQVEAQTETQTEAEANVSAEDLRRGALYYDDKVAQNYLSSHDAYVPLAKDFTHGQRAKFVRGDKKVSRRRPKKSDERNEGPLDERKDLHKGRTYDWREYKPDLHKGVDPYADCPVKAEELKHLDGPEYQAMSAMCKEELIWQKILSDGTRQKFFTGPEF